MTKNLRRRGGIGPSNKRKDGGGRCGDAVVDTISIVLNFDIVVLLVSP